MKKTTTTLLLLVAAGLIVSALPAQAMNRPVLAARHFHGGHRTVIVRGGWGWGPWWGWGWGYPGYAAEPYGYAYGPPVWARVKTDIAPEEARVYLDGRLIGTADDFDGWPDYLYLRRGHYRLEFRLTGFENLSVDVDARPGRTIRFDNHLKKIAGAPRGSYDEPTVAPIRRFWAKVRDSAQPVDPDSERGSDAERYRPEGSRDGDADYAPDPDRAPAPDSSRDSSDWRDRRPADSDVRAPRPQGVSTKSRLRLRIDPPDAAVYVDDRFVGTAEEVNSLEKGIAVSPGPHTVTVSRPGFRDRSEQVEVAAGASQRLEISLSR